MSVVLNAMSPAGYTVPFAASQPANSLPSGGVKVHSGSVKFSPDLTFMGCIVPVPPLGSKEMVTRFLTVNVAVTMSLPPLYGNTFSAFCPLTVTCMDSLSAKW